MGCTPCKEDQQGASVDPTVFGTPMKKRALIGVDRPDSPPASFIEALGDRDVETGTTPKHNPDQMTRQGEENEESA